MPRPPSAGVRSALVTLLLILAALALPAGANAGVRAAFYYPWFPETENWATHYHPTLGQYNSSDPAVIDAHIRQMQYGRIQAGIASWWGRGTPTDNRFPLLLAGSARVDPRFKWAVYYEPEGTTNPSADQIRSDLAYLGKYTADPAYLRLDGKPVVFVYGGAADTDCGVADRWAGTGFYVVLKVFGGYQTCAHQPQGWHQYAPAVREDAQGPYSYSVSPGFFKFNESAPRLVRDDAAWAAAIQRMVASNARFQLVTTFNEWGEGTSVESAQEWASPSGNGYALARLRVNGQAYGTAFTECNDSLDNDFDGASDLGDIDCTSAADTTEGGSSTPPPPPPAAACADGRDNDADGRVDYPADLGCSSATDTDETDPAPPPPAPGSVTVLAAGDIQHPSSTSPTAPIVRNTPHDAVITLGDNQYDSGTLANYNSFWTPNWGTAAPFSRLYPSPGNHDGSLSGYCAYFSGKTPVSPCPPHYHFTLGNWDFYSMYTGSSSGSGDFSAADKTWLDQQLAASTKQCQAVYFHHPRYSAGTHGNSGGLADDWQMMMNRRVDLVLSGHDHNYQRFNLMNANGGVDMTNGIREFVVGTGGESHYGTSNRPAGIQAFNADTYGVLRLTLGAAGYGWQFLPQAGRTFTDSGNGSCR